MKNLQFPINWMHMIIYLGLFADRVISESIQQPLNLEITRDYEICDGCVPRELVHAPGIGFDLSSSYGTAAIRYHDGTFVDIGRVDGLEDYKDLMARISGPYKHYGPPFESPLDEMEYNLDQAKRYIRRSRGLPSTEEISTLSSMLSSLKYLVQHELHMHAKNIVLSLPYLPNLLPEDLGEAMQLSGLVEINSIRHHGPLQSVNGAMAGMGLMICEHWQNIEMCVDEEEEFEYKWILSLTYNYEELVVEIFVAFNAYYAMNFDRFRFTDLSYGTWDRDRSNTTYWDIIGENIVEISRRYDEIDELVLMGEYAQESRFLDSIRRALGSDVDSPNLSKALQNQKFSAEFVAARGAAELAKRWQGETWGCKEGDWCKGNRDY